MLMRDIKRGMIKIFAVGAMAFLLAGCGATAGNGDSGIVNDGNSSAESQKGQQMDNDKADESGFSAGTENTDDAEKADTVTRVGTDSAAAGEEAANNENMDYTKDGIPIYGAGDKKAIRKYLTALPEEYLSFEKAKELGVIRDYSLKDLTEKQMKYFQEKWLSFYTKSRESNDIAEGKRDKDIGTVYRDAIVTVHYTVEGDPIYEYISYTYENGGEYFLYIDSSHDNFSCRASRDKGYSAVYDALKEHRDMEQETTEFYLLKDSSAHLEKLLQKDYSSKELYMAYNLDYLVDTLAIID